MSSSRCNALHLSNLFSSLLASPNPQPKRGDTKIKKWKLYALWSITMAWSIILSWGYPPFNIAR